MNHTAKQNFYCLYPSTKLGGRYR